MENLRPPESVVGRTVFESLYIYVPGRELGASECNLLILITMSYRYSSHFSDERTGSGVAQITAG